MPTEYRQHTQSIWDIMILGQHHGLTTLLLDWSYSPLIALNFATASLENSNEYAVIWKAIVMNANNCLPGCFTDTLVSESKHIFTLKYLKNYTKNCKNELKYFEDNINNGFLFLRLLILIAALHFNGPFFRLAN